MSDKTKELYNDIIRPYWEGRSIRERIFNSVPTEWISSYEAGIFTEFQEQRAPGHTVLGDKIYKKGFLDIKNDIQGVMKDVDSNRDPDTLMKLEELEAMDIAADALILYAERYSDLLMDAADEEKDPVRKNELSEMARICKHVPKHSPDTFWEALQFYWFVHLGVTTELNTWDSFNPGRLDQHLYPFYKKELEKLLHSS